MNNTLPNVLPVSFFADEQRQQADEEDLWYSRCAPLPSVMNDDHDDKFSLRRFLTAAAAYFAALVVLLSCVWANPAFAERVKDLASIQGVRHNQLVGYGLVVGLDGSGDQTTQAPFTAQSIGNMLAQMGVNMTAEEARKLQLKNVAAVMVTASLPPFAQPGQVIDVNVSSMANAKSLSGGTLVLTALKGADGNVYAMAQGSVVIGQEGAFPGGARVTPTSKAAGRVPGGATVERAVPSNVGQSGIVFYELDSMDFSTARRVVNVINKRYGRQTAQAVDGRRIAVRVPTSANERVAFLGGVENLEVRPEMGLAKVVINPRTGSVVMNQKVALEPCAIAHGNLSVVVDDRSTTLGKDVGTQFVKRGDDDPSDARTGQSMVSVDRGASLAEVVRALNVLGASPADLLAILQAMKAAGSLRAELEVI